MLEVGDELRDPLQLRGEYVLVLAGVSAVGALSLLALYIGATQNANGKRKRRRRSDDYSPHPLFDHVEQYLFAGKEQF